MTDADDQLRARMSGGYETPILTEPAPNRPVPPWRPVDEPATGETTAPLNK